MAAHDLRYAARSLARNPGFSAVAVLTLALGIGGSTAIFSLVDAVLLRPLPYRDPSRLVRIWEANPAEGKARSEVAAGTFVEWRRRTRTFEELALFSEDVGLTNRSVLATPSGSLIVAGTSVTPNLFSLLGVQPVIGRAFTSGPTETRGLTQVILSFDLWRRGFASDPAIVDQTVRIEGRPKFVVTGVMPAGLSFPAGTDLWTAEDLSGVTPARHDSRFHGAIGKLKPGSTLAEARRDLTTIAADLGREYPATLTGWTVTLASLRDSIVGGSQLALLTLLAAVGLVLLVGCANISSLLLARGIARRREIAIRAALGASAGRLVRHVLAECFLLAAAGGVASWLLAAATLPLL